ncbi:hypothetical protein [Acinetobacter bohemicus]|uniref:hypothetical protein n=1 Tax=Acinetobacter bohemicus TaxID=1435036 RepID=UPI00192B5BF7|nr:hypothetical protein [Acinetobacter bohemicus]CAD9194156.1 hypothetical protein QAC21B_00243 [Acinetobacter bohemicus]CAD9194911.1 hypothetical protein QAC21B_01012 [Acinetobacter bohemicus]
MMQNLSQEKIRELLDKKFSDIEFELKNNINPDILTGEVIGYLEAFLLMSLITTTEFGKYHRYYMKMKDEILKN